MIRSPLISLIDTLTPDVASRLPRLGAPAPHVCTGGGSTALTRRDGTGFGTATRAFDSSRLFAIDANH